MARIKRLIGVYEDEPDEENYDDFLEEEEGHDGLMVLDGPSDLPVSTGLYRLDGTPFLRHPIRIRMGFHAEDSRYHTPTMDDPYSDRTTGTLGWCYD